MVNGQLLTGEKAKLFNDVLVLKAKKYVNNRFSHLNYCEDLLQEMLLAIANALSEADMDNNATSYAFNAGTWEVSKRLRARFTLCRFAEEVAFCEQNELLAITDHAEEMTSILSFEKAMAVSLSSFKASEQALLLSEIFDYDATGAKSKFNAEYHRTRRLKNRFFEKVNMLIGSSEGKEATGSNNESRNGELHSCCEQKQLRYG